MRVMNKKALAVLLVVLPLTVILTYHWNSGSIASIDIRDRDTLKNLLDERIRQMKYENDNIPYRIKENILRTLAINGCVCESDKSLINIPFAQKLFPQVSATQLNAMFQGAELQRAKQYRNKEFQSFRKRTFTAADSLIIADANNPLQYPTQGVEVRPTRTILIPVDGLTQIMTHVTGFVGHGQKCKPVQYVVLPACRDPEVHLTATMGTFDTAVLVDGLQISGEGEMHISFVSDSLALLNRQLQFVTYTNTQFHPNTADVVQFKTTGFQAVFTIKIRHPPMPTFYNPGPKRDYNVSTLVTIATKTFLRYDKLQDLIDSIRKFYPTVTIVIADDTKDPKPVKGPYIEHYLMPFGKGWFPGRNLAVSQVTTKYVLWVDDDFIFTSNTKLEKMVDILERTTLDLVGGGVREVTGYTANYRHIITTDAGDEEGDCLHIRKGYHHVIEGFPNCVVADAVINFFMARTEKIRKVTFDPRLARVGHLAFFIDGLGTLHVGSCDDVIINHASKIKGMLPWGQSETDKAYSAFRYPSEKEEKVNEYDLYYLKNHFKCITSD